MTPAALSVLARYPEPVARGTLLPLGNHGGFSGARLWRVEGPAGAFVLRAWPAALPVRDLPALAARHRLMAEARSSGLNFVPAVLPTRDGPTAVLHVGWLWDLCQWVPGVADYHTRPSRARLRAACTALARLHRAWERHAGPPSSPCPAIARRLACLRGWNVLLRSGWNPNFPPGDPCAERARRAWLLLERRAGEIPGQLHPWLDRSSPVQPCLCDVWHDHLLFEGEALTGLVDYGAVKPDHVSVDLARMLGSLVGDGEEAWSAGLAAYREVRPLSTEEEALARALDRTGVVLGLVNWLRWLYVEERPFADRAAVARRMGALVERVEGW
jgi:Ser/Thr protein kinase RdoA (MazF antagonist)